MSFIKFLPLVCLCTQALITNPQVILGDLLLVRPGVIETPTVAWQATVIPLNHGRNYKIVTFLTLLLPTQSIS
jgi:hypothetical protein